MLEYFLPLLAVIPILFEKISVALGCASADLSSASSDLLLSSTDLLLSDLALADLLSPDLSTGWLDRTVDQRCRFKFAARYGTTCHDGRDITATSTHARTSRPLHWIFCAQ